MHRHFKDGLQQSAQLSKCFCSGRLGNLFSIQGEGFPILVLGAATQPPGPNCLTQWKSSYASKGKSQGKGLSAASAADVSFNVKSVEQSMGQTLKHLQERFRSLRTGRLSEGMLDILRVDAHGDSLPLKAVGSVSVRDARTLLVSVFDPGVLQAVEKAIRASSLGLNPVIEGNEIVVPVPRPTRESLNAVAKLLKDEGESAKVSIRQTRKSAMATLKAWSDKNEQKRLEKQTLAAALSSIQGC